MSILEPTPPAPHRWKRPVYLAIVVAAIALVLLVWFHTPEVEVASDGNDEGYTMVRCANAGPLRWDPPRVRPGQELDAGQGRETFNQLILRNDIESLRIGLACDQARDAHTNALIVTTFVAGAIMFFGYPALWARREIRER